MRISCYPIAGERALTAPANDQENAELRGEPAIREPTGWRRREVTNRPVAENAKQATKLSLVLEVNHISRIPFDANDDERPFRARARSMVKGHEKLSPSLLLNPRG